MLKTLLTLAPKIKIQKKSLVNSFKVYSTNTANEPTNSNAALHCYLEQESEILKVVNKGTVQRLNKCGFKMSYAKEIISNRKTHGHYESLNDLFSRNELEPDILEGIIKCITSHNNKARKTVIKPDICNLKILDTVLGLHVGPSVISWALVNNDFEVLNWSYIPWSISDLRSSAYNTIQMVQQIVKIMPEASVYIMEDTTFSTNKSIQHILNMQQQLSICTMACLNTRHSHTVSSASDIVYVLNCKAAANFFNLYVGSEIISTDYAVKPLIDNTVNPNFKGNIQINISEEMKLNYTKTKPEEKQQLSWSLLKALVFLYEVKN